MTQWSNKAYSETTQLKIQIVQLKQQLGQLKASDSTSYNELLRMGHKELAMELADRYGAYSQEEGVAFQKDLEVYGRFPAPDRSQYVIVNFRATGHSKRPGANAPALDTGLVGVRQIIKAVEDALKDKKVVIVPMGEEPGEYKNRPNLLNYWLWPSTPDRRKQLALLKYLKDKYEIIGAIGMRSGVLDQIAFNNIRIISIDITPHRFDPQTGLPNVKPSKGWDRGLQLEAAYDDAYGRVFVKYPRQQDLDRFI